MRAMQLHFNGTGDHRRARQTAVQQDAMLPHHADKQKRHKNKVKLKTADCHTPPVIKCKNGAKRV
jgi:hypothetical protein